MSTESEAVKKAAKELQEGERLFKDIIEMYPRNVVMVLCSHLRIWDMESKFGLLTTDKEGTECQQP